MMNGKNAPPLKRQRSSMSSRKPDSSLLAGCSWFRLIFFVGITALVSTNVVRLNSRYLREIYTQGEHAVAMALGVVDSFDTILDQPTNRHPLPPIYWINLDSSAPRRKAMREMFASLGITDTHRVSAMDVNQTIDLWNQTRLIFHPNVTLEAKDGRPSNKKHIENIYEYQEAACLMSHLKAIQTAYNDGHDQVLILEDDALLSHHFLNLWKPYVDRAPLDWQILQFATNNPNVVKQGVHLIDYFITWQPYHWSTRAYIINRAGMQTIMDTAYSVSPKGEDIWRIDQDPIVVADEVLYYVIKDSYTSTGLWVDSMSFESSIQSKNAHSNLTTLIGDSSNRKALVTMMNEEKYTQSLLILMNVRARNLEELAKELAWIRQDNHAVCQLHETCEWEINLVFTDAVLLENFQQAVDKMPSNIHFHPQVNADAFNKFSYVRDFVSEMAEYDLVLFKDNDQRINGFPWRTFVAQKGDAVVSGPLRQSREEALLYRHSYSKRQWFQFHAAEAWTEDWNTKWSSKLFAEVIPTEVPLLEMYFVLFDAKFANYFFDLVLTPEFVNQTSAWGPDLLWCSAAQEWNPKRPSCNLVPVSSSHEDTRQIFKNTTKHKDGGFQMVNKFKENPLFDKWMKVPEKWSVVIGGHLLWQIERRCRKLLKLRLVFPFKLEECPKKVKEILFNQDKRAGITAARVGGVNYQRMNQKAQEYLNPWLSQLQNRNNSHVGIQNRSRVAELVAAVKMSRNHTAGTTIRNRTVDADDQVQRKSLDAFQNRLAELKQLRAERLLANKNPTGESSYEESDRQPESVYGL